MDATVEEKEKVERRKEEHGHNKEGGGVANDKM
jgi:hypothetical protein